MESCTTAQPSGKWKSRKRRAWSLRCERVHGSGSEKGGEGCAIRCDGWQDKVFKCHEIQPEQGTRKGRFARSLLATLSEGEGRQEREGGWRGRRTAVVLSDLQRLSLPHSRLCRRGVKRSHDARGPRSVALPLGPRPFSEYQGCHARRRRRPPSFALLANGDTRKWVLTGPVSLRDGMEGGREAEGYNRAPFTPRAAKPVD